MHGSDQYFAVNVDDNIDKPKGSVSVDLTYVLLALVVSFSFIRFLVYMYDTVA